MLWPKKSTRCPFFRSQMKKSHLSCPYFIKKTCPSSKNAVFSCPYFVKKTSILKKHATVMPIVCQKNVHYLKNTMLSCHLFLFFMKNPCFHAHIWSKKHKFCQNYTILWDKIVNRKPFLLIFHQKSLLSCPLFVRKMPIL